MTRPRSHRDRSSRVACALPLSANTRPGGQPNAAATSRRSWSRKCTLFSDGSAPTRCRNLTRNFHSAVERLHVGSFHRRASFQATRFSGRGTLCCASAFQRFSQSTVRIRPTGTACSPSSDRSTAPARDARAGASVSTDRPSQGMRGDGARRQWNTRAAEYDPLRVADGDATSSTYRHSAGRAESP